MKGFKPSLLTSALALATTAAAYAGHSGEISDILVTAPEYTLGSGTQLLKEDLLDKSATTSDSAALLRDIPGVSLYGAGGVSSLPVLHGLADDRIRIKVDGMDLVSACGNHMNPPLSYIDPTAVESIEVFAGITPVSQGGDSIAGSILVKSAGTEFAERNGETQRDFEIGSFYRSNGDAHGINLRGSAAGTHFGVRYSGAYATSDNYHAGGNFKAEGPAAFDRGFLAADEVGSSAYESQNHKLGVALRRDNHLFDLELAYQHIPYQGFPNQRMDMLDNTSTQVVLRHEGDYEKIKVNSRAYFETTSHNMNFGDDKQFWYGDAPGMPMETEGENLGITSQAEIALDGNNLVRIGAEAQQYSLDDWWKPSGSGMMMSPNTFWNIRDGERDRYGLFGEWQASPSEHWLTTFGVRYENVRMDTGDVAGYSMMYAPDAQAFNSRDHKKSDDNWDFTAQAQYSPDARQTYKAGIARKSRSPNLYERYTWSTVGMAMRMVNLAGNGNGYVGNLSLEPEIAHTLSVSADWHDEARAHWQLVVTPFYTLVDDYMDATPCTTAMCNMSNMTPGFRYLTFANEDARLYGVDVSGFRHIASLESIGELRVAAIINYVDGENEATGDNLYNIMPLNARVKLEQESGNWQTTVEWQLVSSKDDTSDVRNEIATAGYGLLHLRSAVTLGQLRLDAGVENLLDKAYDLPLGGAYVGQGQTMGGTGTPWGIAVPGAGRSLYAGVTYSF